MKTITITLFTSLLFFFTNAFAQNPTGSVWVTVEDLNILPINDINGKFYSPNVDFQVLMNNNVITSVVQAVPSSQNPDLLKVFELNCECDELDLINDINQSSLPLSNPEPGPDYNPLFEPNDKNLVFASDYALDNIHAEEAWDMSTGDQSVEIAITDTNFDLGHEELQGATSIINGPFNYPNYYHGTAVAITAAGNTNNNTGKASIGADCALQLYNMNYNELLTAAYNNADIINVSWSSGCSHNTYFQQIIDEVHGNGSTIVAAAGNGVTCGGASNLVFPASFNHVIAVTSVGPQDNHEKTIGDPYSTHQHNMTVDLAAPGYDVALSVSDGWYLTGNGSSFAAPYVSGTIGLMKSVNPCLTPDEIETILKESADDIDALNPQYAGLLGSGRLNAQKAVEIAASYAHLQVDLMEEFDCELFVWELFPEMYNVTNSTQLSYEWSTGSTDSTAYAWTSGQYIVKMIDENGCFGIDTIDITAHNPITTTISSNALSCPGDEDAAIEVLAAGGNGWFTYTWDTGETTSSISNLSGGIYTVEVMDGEGCSILESITIDEPNAIETTGLIGCDFSGTGDGTIDLETIGGTAPYSYTWSNGETTQNISDLQIGTYTVQLVDANGCAAQEDYVVCGVALDISENNMNLNIYPNPSSGSESVMVSWSGEVDGIDIYNLSGQLIDSRIVSHSSESIMIENLSAGLYIVELKQSSEKIGQEKLVVSK